jgi:penicillin-binding protein 1B
MFKIVKNRFFWYITLLLFMALVGYLIYLNYVIGSRFEAKRWNLPSRIYSDTFALYPGQTTTVAELKTRLKNLGYRGKSQKPEQPGHFHQQDETFEIFLHNFEYPHENFKGFPVIFQIQNKTITNLRHLTTQEPITLTHLEPELIASIYDDNMENRTFVALNHIPRILTEAVILIEDERFYSHHGVDPIGILRALFKNISSGRVVQGGSTLTQQMVKNFFLTHEKTLLRKINEAFMAIIIDFRYSKEDIIEVYLNEIYFGQQGATSITGVQEASRYYFSKNVSQLTASEAAMLAGIIKAPGIYSPFVNKTKAKERRNLILKRLEANRVITKKTYQRALKQRLPRKSAKRQKTRAPYFIDFIRKQLKENFPASILKSEGLRIFTTLDMHWQRLAEKTVKEHLAKLEQGRPLLKKNKSKGLNLEGALIALQPKTGFIRAYVGGKNYYANQFDILSQAKRQPGSTFKPFAYLAAIDPEQTNPPFTAASMLVDEPIKMKTGASLWKPNNYDKKFHGLVRLRTALEKSYNVATVWLAGKTGLKKIVSAAQKAGMNEDLKPFPSLVLGAFEVTPLELAQAYTVFPNNGQQSKPIAIRRVITPDGRVLEKKSFETKKIFSHDAIYIMNKLMQGVMDHGTGVAARAYGFNKLAAGKTGTTSEYRDAWFAGYTPDILTLTWTGYKSNETTNLSGASGALPLWALFMKKVTEGKQYHDFTATENIVIVPIDNKTGLLYHRSCSERLDEYFIEGTQPTEYCHK